MLFPGAGPVLPGQLLPALLPSGWSAHLVTHPGHTPGLGSVSSNEQEEKTEALQ